MAILSRDDFMGRVKTLAGDKTDDETLKMIEDFSDTYSDLEAKATATDTEDWKAKYDELDKNWREKYTARFFSGEGTTTAEAMADQRENVEADGEVRDFADLFEEREG